MKTRIEMETDQHPERQHPHKKEALPKAAAPKPKAVKVAAKVHRKTTPR